MSLRTPSSIIAGYLGSGKTTFLKRVLEKVENKRLAIILNEFGELQLEGKLIKGKNVNMVELGGGCVCCSLAGEFEFAVREIISTVKPDMILVEATGIAEPDSLASLFQQSLQEVSLDSIITIVDAYAMVKYPSLGHTGRVQIEMADVIIINKVDLVNEDEVKEVERRVREINSRAIIMRAIRCDVDINLILGLKMDRYFKFEEHEKHVIEEDLLSFKAQGKFDREKFEEFLGSLPEEVYRMKGSVIFKDGGSYFVNYVIGRFELEPFSSEDIKLIFVGKGIRNKKEEIIRRIKESLEGR
ncbi:MAG: GTP-binding protein [Nitrososphaerales archaeon]